VSLKYWDTTRDAGFMWKGKAHFTPRTYHRVKTIQQDNTWVTAGIRVSGKRLRFLHNLMKKGNVSEEDKKYYSHYKKIYNKVIIEAKQLTNNRRICTSENK
jgi:hypothetical protein